MDVECKKVACATTRREWNSRRKATARSYSPSWLEEDGQADEVVAVELEEEVIMLTLSRFLVWIAIVMKLCDGACIVWSLHAIIIH